VASPSRVADSYGTAAVRTVVVWFRLAPPSRLYAEEVEIGKVARPVPRHAVTPLSWRPPGRFSALQRAPRSGSTLCQKENLSDLRRSAAAGIMWPRSLSRRAYEVPSGSVWLGPSIPLSARARRIATPIAAADPANSAKPTAISAPLGPLGGAAPPKPVCGPPEGRTLLVPVGVADADSVEVLVVVGLADALEVSVGVVLGVVDGVVLGVVVGVVVGVVLGDGLPVAVELVVKSVAPAATDTYMDCSYITEPVALGPA
jgi:hypothetical protein